MKSYIWILLFVLLGQPQPGTNDDPGACNSDVRECPDGSSVGRVPPDCEFEECPEIACPSDIMECPDGSTVVRVPPDCEFEECPEIACPTDIMECPDGSTVVRVPPDCEFEECPEIACPSDIMECPDGSTVVRVPPDCEFEDCPPTASPTPAPTDPPTPSPTESTPSPTDSPSASPTEPPTDRPSASPTEPPTDQPSASPTEKEETDEPTESPSRSPSAMPSSSPSAMPSSQPSSSPSSRPSSSPSARPSVTPSASPSVAPTEVGASARPSATPSVSPAPSSLPTAVPPTNCSEYQYEIDVPGQEGMTMQYVVNINFNDSAIINNDTTFSDLLFVSNNNNNNNNNGNDLNSTIYGTMSVRLIYEGQAWLGFGISPTGDVNGSDAVIGLPSDDGNATTGNVSKYHLTYENDAPGYVLLGEEQQTLMDAYIYQDADYTVMEFTKLLEEEGEVPIDGNGFNYFLAAHGGDSNELDYIDMDQWSSFNLTLEPCIPDFLEDVVDFIGDIEDAIEDLLDDLAELGGDEGEATAESFFAGEDSSPEGGEQDGGEEPEVELNEAVEAAEQTVTTTERSGEEGPTSLESGTESRMGRQQGVIALLFIIAGSVFACS